MLIMIVTVDHGIYRRTGAGAAEELCLSRVETPQTACSTFSATI